MPARKSRAAKSPRRAPGDLRLIQDFVNTRDHETGDDALPGPRELNAWLVARDLLPEDVRLGGADWRAAIEIRDGLRGLIQRRATGAAVERLNDALGETGPRWRFDADGSLRLEPGGEGWSAVRHRLLSIVYEAMRAGRWSRFKTCHNQACQRVFYDAARNRMGKWCDMARCGNSVKAKAYRQRGRAGKRGRLTNSLIR